MSRSEFEEFTVAGYESLLKATLNRWRMIGFGEHRSNGTVCLWRHDVDMSVHRAAKLATIEAAHGAKATYFIHLHSEFYNLFEGEIASRIVAIHQLGHDIGVHFDPGFYTSTFGARHHLAERLEFEKQTLERLLSVTLTAFSIHNPDVGDALDSFRQFDDVAGMVNAYGPSVTRRFSYISDSNGYWRHRRPDDFLSDRGGDTDAAPERLHVLTHPEWWTDVPLSPRARVARCAEGRHRRQLECYDDFLRRAGRQNIR